MRIAIVRNRSAAFLLFAIGIVLACAAIVRSRAFAANADVAAWGVTFDLTISIPVLYWFLIVRSGKAPAFSVAPVFLVGAAIAAFLLPRGQQEFLRELKFFAIPAAEVVLIAALVQRLRRMRLESSASADPYIRISTALRAIIGNARAAEIVASEVSIFYYALFCWRKQPKEVQGHAFTVHERSGWGTVLACILVLIVAEGIGMHLLLSMWSPVAAWVWTALDVWGVLWLLGDYHALRLRRSSIDDEALHLRQGLRWSVTVPLETIVSVEPVRSEAQWKHKDVLKVAMLDEPRWLISFAEPLVASSMAGIRKEVRAIALLPDDDVTIRALRDAIDRKRGTREARA